MGDAKRRKQLDPNFGTRISYDGYLKIYGIVIKGVRSVRSKKTKYFPGDFIFLFPERKDLRAAGIGFSQHGTTINVFLDHRIVQAVDALALSLDTSIGNYEMIGSKDFIEIKIGSCPVFDANGNINIQYLSVA